MNSKSAKGLLFGLAIILFSLMLVFAGFVFVLLDALPAVVNTGQPIGLLPLIILVAAIVVGIVGLALAYDGFARKD